MTLPELETMDRVALCAAWTEMFGTAVPRGLSRALLQRFLATELQSRRLGGLSKPVMKILSADPDAAAAKSSRLKSGGRLLREWNGVTHAVEVTAAGYIWNGATYRSLSAIARAITGAHWSGPRFFGLTGGEAR